MISNPYINNALFPGGVALGVTIIIIPYQSMNPMMIFIHLVEVPSLLLGDFFEKNPPF